MKHPIKNSKPFDKLSRANKKWDSYINSLNFHIRKSDLKSENVSPSTKTNKHLLLP